MDPRLLDGRLAVLGLALLAACGRGVLTVSDGPGGDPADDGSPEAAETDEPTPEDEADETDAPDTDRAADTAPTGETGPPADTGYTDPTPGRVPNLQQTGPLRIAEGRSSFTVGGGCTIDYQLIRPSGGSPVPAAVVLAHGFARAPDQMIGWARHFASWGLDVYVPDRCSPFDHEENGRDLAAFVDRHLRGRAVVYAGHSAGGLTALLAAAQDPDALGVLGLDLVDNGDLGRTAAAGFGAPVRNLVAVPYLCNSDGNGLAAVAAAPDGQSLRVTDANHCDFEKPTDGTCTLTCGDGSVGWGFQPSFGDVRQREVIAGVATGFLMAVTGLDPEGTWYWTPGQAPYDTLLSEGVLQVP